jgi:hypothetical protein
MKSELSVYRDKDGSCSIWRGEKALAGGLSDKDAMEMAAGPELLEALATLVGIAETDCMDDKSNVWRSAMIDANAAIAKAEGRS